MYPVLFKIGPITIHAYGVFVALAFLTGFLLVHKEAKRKNFYADRILDLELVILVFGIAGARALHVLVNLDFYKNNILEIFLIWRGGLAIYGGLFFAIIASVIFVIKNKMSVWKTADLIFPYVALGQSIGRIGCFFNGCCFGKPAGTSFLGVLFPGDIVSRYPTQVFASLLLLCIFIVLRIASERKFFSGFTFGFYLVLYGTQRFFVDFLRDDTPRYFLNLTISQLISVAVFLIGLVLITSRKVYSGNTKIYSR